MPSLFRGRTSSRSALAAAMALVIASLAGPALAQTNPGNDDTLFDPAKHMRVDEVKVGMKGYGLTVFKGTKIERFEVEVVDILEDNFGPDMDVVLIMCQGEYMRHVGPVQGMSGSPIFLYDESGKERMIGAFAFGWGLIKDRSRACSRSSTCCDSSRATRRSPTSKVNSPRHRTRDGIC